MKQVKQSCMTAPWSKVRKTAQKLGIEYVTLDTKENRLKVCHELSLHVQNMFTKQGVNPLVKDLLYEQESQLQLH